MSVASVEQFIGSDDFESPLSPDGASSSSRRANALSMRISTVLSSSYADSELREALRLFDQRRAQPGNNLKALAEKEVIDSNAQIVDDFGHVAAVSRSSLHVA